MAANTYIQTVSQLALGLEPTETVHRNLQPAALYEIAVRAAEGQVAHGGSFCAVTAPHTGRSPKDKFVVREPSCADDIWWGKVNQPLSPDHWASLCSDVIEHLSTQPLHVQDLIAGADPAVSVPVRFITPNAWHALFVQNMFIRPQPEQLVDFEPGFTVLHAPEMHADPNRHGTNTGTFIVVNFAERTVLIGGTRYAGEMKKSMFTILNYLYPKQGILSMHCSRNAGRPEPTRY